MRTANCTARGPSRHQYQQGCRCVECVECHRSYQRAYRFRDRSEANVPIRDHLTGRNVSDLIDDIALALGSR